MPFTTVETAQLILINLARYNEEKGKSLSRIRLSKTDLRSVAGRTLLRGVFLEELEEAFSALGWHFVERNDSEFFLLEKEKLNSWARLGVSRIKQDISNLEEDPAYANEIKRIFFDICNVESSSDGE